MPRYDVRCRSCGDTFEISRSITALDEPAPCPSGHTDTVRLLRTVAVTGVGSSGSGARSASGSSSSQSSSGGGGGGGCCGGGCCG